MEQQHILVSILSQMTRLSPEESADIESAFPIKTFPKGTYLLREGQLAKAAYYVLRGIIREYTILDGEEKTTAFYTEDQSAANFHSLANGVPSSKYFVCAEESSLAVLSSEKEEELYRKYPRFEQFCRTGMESMMGQQQEDLSRFLMMDPESRYRSFLKERPGLSNRIPQYQLASYLGIKPETLSRIRKRMAARG